MKAILFPTDFSQPARAALDYAAALAQALGASLTLLHVLRIPGLDPDTFISDKPFLTAEEAGAELEKLRAEIAGSTAVHTDVRSGNAVAEIKKAAAAHNADLVVTGTKGSGNSPDVLVGSTTSKLIESAAVSVLAVPSGAVFSKPERIVFASDLKSADTRTLAPLISLATAMQSEILLLHVSATETAATGTADTLQLLKGLFGSLPLSAHSVPGTDVAEAIGTFAQTQRAALVAIVAHKHGLLTSFFGLGVTRAMTLHTHLPLLALADPGA